jgi:hypothetical protein
MVRFRIVLTGVAIYNHLWEQDVGGSNPLAPTKYSVKTPSPDITLKDINSKLCAYRPVG